MRLTIFYDGQFWVGIVEENEHGRLKAARWLFGAEPKDAEVLMWVQKDMLPFFSRTIHSVDIGNTRWNQRINPKRRARQAAKELKKQGVSTYAQQAIQKELEGKKQEKKEMNKEQKEERKRRKREQMVQKKKEKHRGR